MSSPETLKEGREEVMYHEPVCVKCECEFRPEKNGIGLLDMASYGPVKIWEADLYKCPKCGTEIVVGFGQRAAREHYQDGFGDWVAYKKEHSQVIKSY